MMSTTVWTHELRLNSLADTALKAAARFWFVVAVIGQWAFLFYIIAFYGPSTFTGNFQVWTRNTLLLKGYVAGDTAGNLAFAAHALLAAVIAFGGTIQLVPQIRARAISVHRWVGRVFFVTALGLSFSGLYMEWIRGARLNMVGALAISLNAVLIIAFVGLAWRAARSHEISAHRRWALRTYLVANAQWFTRVGVFAWIIANRGPAGIGANFDGPFIIFWGFGSYLLPLAMLEFYLRAMASSGPRRRLAVAGGLVVLTVLMGVGIFGVAMAAWLPAVKAAYDPRKSIVGPLSATIATGGIEQATEQYHDLKASASATYNFDEGQLNTLGYQLIRANKFKEAIRILQLNVETYSQSSNVYDSLAEAYMDGGDKPQAIANYRKSLQLNPKNGNAVQMLQKLNSP
jgi:tetratricopeptide (TPR) repeat protein